MLLAVLCPAHRARADTVVSLLGNYTINQFVALHVDKHRVTAHYVVVMGQIPALKALHGADTNHDGVTSESERSAYLKKMSPRFARHLRLQVDGRRLPWHLVSWHTGLPSDDSGFSLRFDAYYTASLPAATGQGIHHLRCANTNYGGRNGWKEIVVRSGAGVSIFDTNAASRSLTHALRENPGHLPPGGPLDQRSVHLAFTQGPPPAGSVPLGPNHAHHANPSARHGDGASWWGWLGRHVMFGAWSPSTDVTAGSSGGWFQRATRQLTHLISPAGQAGPGLALLALLFAALLGAAHALSPGHGKTVVGAYLVGTRGTPRHAAFLGLTVTVTHTAGVFMLGAATLVASQYIVPERLFPVLSLVSALMVVIIGVVLLIARIRDWRRQARNVEVPDAVPPGAVYRFQPTGATSLAHRHDHDHDHDHSHSHSHSHSHDHVDASGVLWHRHGGGWHSHRPPGADGERVTWKSLLALGISGGLVPCPSALVLLLAAIAVHRTAYGMVLVLAFSVGLAAMLTAVGLLFLYARRFLDRRSSRQGRFLRILPVLSAGLIVLVGCFMCYAVLAALEAGF
ncbi:hypothetical protein SALB1_1575 [Salinisphaera sp. LB1]|nr:hypothetical protein SALB1_1575 [Salinisphaera sp. LB1]